MRTSIAIERVRWSVRVAAFAFAVGVVVLSTPALRAQAGVQGQWTTLPYAMPINPVHLALMNNGKVLIVSGSGNVAAETNFRAAVWDPQAETIAVTQSLAWDMFCNGMVVAAGRPRRSSTAATFSTTRSTASRATPRSIPRPACSPTCRTWRTAAGIRP